MLTLTLALAMAQTPSDPDEVALPDGLDEVVRVLAYRHPTPCDEVEAHTPTPVATLRYVVAHVEHPPWAPMRAAECLQRNHAEEVRTDLLRWVSDPAVKGLGRQTVSLIEVLPEAIAVEVGRQALQGPVAERARSVLAQDGRPAVAELPQLVPVEPVTP